MNPFPSQTSSRSARRMRGDGGFTLIELLVVIVIIGVLSAVVIFSVTGINDRGQESACKSDKNTLKVAEEASYAQDGVYTTEALLKTNGFIEDESTLYNITLSGTAPDQDYAIAPATGSSCTA